MKELRREFSLDLTLKRHSKYQLNGIFEFTEIRTIDEIFTYIFFRLDFMRISQGENLTSCKWLIRFASFE